MGLFFLLHLFFSPGNIRNTERLSYDKQQHYKIMVTAYDCGQKRAMESVLVHIDVKPVCKPGWQGQWILYTVTSTFTVAPFLASAIQISCLFCSIFYKQCTICTVLLLFCNSNVDVYCNSFFAAYGSKKSVGVWKKRDLKWSCGSWPTTIAMNGNANRWLSLGIIDFL